MTDRAKVIAKARHLAALADHPATPEEEKKTSRELLQRICEKHEISVGELAGPQRTGTKLFREIERSVGSELANKVYQSFAIDEILDSIGDERSRELVDSGLAHVVEFISGRK